MKRIVLIAVLVACGNKKDKPAPAGETLVKPGSGSEIVGSAAAGSGSAVAADDKCKQPCLLLRDTKLADARAQCTAWAVGKGGEEGCDAADHARNCIYAAYGYTFKKDRWKKVFGDEPWYKPDPAFAETAMSATATANIAELKQLAAACRRSGAISAKTRTAIEAWFAARKKGKPALPDKVTDLDGQLITKEEFAKSFLGKDSQLFFHDPWEPFEFVEKRGNADVVEVSTGWPDPTKCTSGDENCEGFESLKFVVEDGKIVALEAFAAACPFVYERTDSGWAYRGEILRNLATPAVEATQSLALGPSSCSATRTIRITEEKRERTYLDSVALAIDGDVIRPDACASTDAHVCADDGRYLELATGDAIELVFTLPAPSCSSGALVANGYYVPLP